MKILSLKRISTVIPYALLLIGVLAVPTLSHADTYAPAAVHFVQGPTPTTFGTASALTSAGTSVSGGDTGATAATSKFTISFWIKGTADNSSHGDHDTTLINSDFMSARGNSSYNSSGIPGINVNWDNSGGNYGTLRVNLGDASSSAAAAAGHTCSLSIPNDFFKHHVDALAYLR